MDERVQKYLNSKHVFSKEPLVFSNSTGWMEEDNEIKLPNNIETLPLEEIIPIIIDYSWHYNSSHKLESGELDVETLASRTRSSLDIWRHILYILPNTTLEEVMQTLFKIKDVLVGHICDTIRRRVFALKSQRPDWHLNYQHYRDEYGLELSEWETIS